MDYPLKVEFKRESIDIEEEEIIDIVGCSSSANDPSGCLQPRETLGPVYANLEPAVFAENSSYVSDSKPMANKVSLSSIRILKESNIQNLSKMKKLKADKLQAKESYLKMKESILAVKEASIKCQENILKIKETNLRIREAKLLKKETKGRSKKIKSQTKVSKENKGSTDSAEIKPESVTESMQKCNICNKMLKYKMWITHMREVHSPTTYVCYCKKFFHGRRLYDRHIQFVHNGVSRYPKNYQYTAERVQCPKCDMMFDHQYRLKTHIRNVHSGEGKEIKCTLCDSKLKSQSYLNTHMRRVHYDDGKSHTCKICGESFDSPRYVLVHIRNSHEKHGIKIRSPKRQVICEEKQDWCIENKKKFKRSKKSIQKFCESWQIENEPIETNDMAKKLHEVKLELVEDTQGFSLEEVMLDPLQDYVFEKEVKLEKM